MDIFDPLRNILNIQDDQTLINVFEKPALKIKQFLLDKGIDVNDLDYETYMETIRNYYMELNQFLTIDDFPEISHLLVEKRELVYRQAFLNATWIGSLETVQILSKDDMLNEQIQNDALANAARNGHLEIVQFLNENGAVINDQSLVNAAENGHLNVVRFLVNKGVIVNISALINASRNGHLNIVQFLIEKGTIIPKQLHDNILKHTKYLNIIKFLLDYGARDVDYEALYELIEYEAIVKLLLEYSYPREVIEQLLSQVSNPKIVSLLQDYLNKRFLISPQEQKMI